VLEPDLAPSPTAPADDVRPEVSWACGEAVIGWIAALVFSQITLSAVLVVTGIADTDDLSIGALTLANSGLWVGFVGCAWFVSRFKGSGLGFVRDLGLRIRAIDVPVGLAWGAATQLAIIPLLYVPVFLLTDTTVEDLSGPANDLGDRATGVVGGVLLVVFVAVLAPLAEEIFWRGVALRAIERRFGRWPAIVGSGMLFSASHFQPVGFLGLSAIGIVLGYLTIRYERLGPAIAAHMAFNAVTVIDLLVR
jgi:membrane protease YdiL (CAAX protease family)